jgi:hypothetical protein
LFVYPKNGVSLAHACAASNGESRVIQGENGHHGFQKVSPPFQDPMGQ